MNERIEALLKQATVPGAPQIGIDDYIDHEKFAELIVQECIDMVDKVYHEETGMGNKLGRRQTPYQEIVNAIEDHFGVES